MSKKSRAPLLDEYAGIEQPELPEQARGEELNVRVVHLNYRDQPHQIRDVLESVRIGGEEIGGKAEQMLTVRLSADCSILSLTPPPRCYLRGLEPEDEPQAA